MNWDGLKTRWKEGIFGAPIAKSFGTIEQETNGMAGGRIGVHLLDTPAPRTICLELISTSLLSYSMSPVKLSRDEAQRLIDALTQAVKEA